MHHRADAASFVQMGSAHQQQHLSVADQHRTCATAVADGRRYGEARDARKVHLGDRDTQSVGGRLPTRAHHDRDIV